MTVPRIGSMCTGYGGLDLAARHVLGAELAWVCETDPDAAAVLAHNFPDVPNLGDVRLVDWSAVEPVDILTAGYPCQPYGVQGAQKGRDDERDLGPVVTLAACVLGPSVVFLENVPGHRNRGFADRLADLAGCGFDAEWLSLGAWEVGAPHPRTRLFAAARPQAPVADPEGLGGGVPGPQADPVAAEGGHGTRGRPSRLEPRGRAAFDLEWRTGPGPWPGAEALVEQLLDGRRAVDWQQYGDAVERWERCLGRPAPDPIDPVGRVNARFLEWMHGLPDGWVTAAPVDHPAALRLLGNGVCPPQAAAALDVLLARLAEPCVDCEDGGGELQLAG